ncbi:hypothetical protein [Micromonospora sp. DT229]|uniref:FtsB family cell division protein n=1 Tax=Micromonospora sp. DT229 TaxID=3393430 RepID=UPI003CF43E75
MPATVPTDPRSKQLLTALFWGGVALAPVAALILLVADGNGPLRFAALLAIMAVVLIGLSITLRADNGGQQHTEELRAEIEQLQRELRSEIVAAAQRSNQALNEVERVQQALAGLRHATAVPASSTGSAPPVSGEPVGAGRARVAMEPEAPPPAGEHPAPPSPEDRPAPTPHADRPASAPYADRPAPAPYADRAASVSFGERAAPGAPGKRPGSPGGVYGSTQPAGQGVVRHTETVHVTTRHTIVDGGVLGEPASRFGGYAPSWSAPQGERGGPGADRDDRPWSEGDERPRHDDDRAWSGPGREEQGVWSDGRDGRPWPGPGDDRSAPVDPVAHREDRPGYREDRPAYRDGGPGFREERPGYGEDRPVYRDGGPGFREERHGYRDEGDWAVPRDERNWGESGQQWGSAAEAAPDRSPRADDTGEYWAELRAGDRWAAVRDDERGREFRAGERRAEMHADHAGTEYRMADRWASVRHGEPRRAADGDEGWRDGPAEERRPALPPGGVPVPEEWRAPRQRGHHPEAGRGQHAEPVRGYQPEPVRGHQAEPPRGHQPEPYGRRHRAEDTGYGPPVQDPGNRWH